MAQNVELSVLQVGNGIESPVRNAVESRLGSGVESNANNSKSVYKSYRLNIDAKPIGSRDGGEGAGLPSSMVAVICGVVGAIVVVVFGGVVAVVVRRRRRTPQNSVDQRAADCDMEDRDGVKKSFVSRLANRNSLSTNDERKARLERQILEAQSRPLVKENAQRDSNKEEDFAKRLAAILDKTQHEGKIGPEKTRRLGLLTEDQRDSTGSETLLFGVLDQASTARKKTLGSSKGKGRD